MTAREFILSLPARVDRQAIAHSQTVFHFDLEGHDGGQFTLLVGHGEVEVQEGLQDTPRCVIRGQAEDVMDLVNGNLNPLVAILTGKVKVSNQGELLKYAKIFGLM